MVKSKFYNLDTDTNLGGENSSDLYVASEKAVKAYVDNNIPTVNNATLTITQGGTNKGTFTANASSNVTIALDAVKTYSAGDGIDITNDTISIDSTVVTEVELATVATTGKSSDLNNDAGFITGITSSDVTTALGYTPYNSSNPSGYQANVIETVKVNGTALTPTNKAVDISVPSAVTETTVSGWGFTKNVGTVTSVNNTSPDANGNVTISIPSISNLADKDLSNLSSTGNAKFQAPLVSGTNIKTVNNTSLLGSGNISVGVSMSYDSTTETLTIS